MEVDVTVPESRGLLAFVAAVVAPFLEAFAVGDDPPGEFVRDWVAIDGHRGTPTHEAGCSEKAALFRGGYVGRGCWRGAYEIRRRVLLAVIRRFSGRIDTHRQQRSGAALIPVPSLGSLTRPPCQQR